MLDNELIRTNQKEDESFAIGFLRLNQVLKIFPISRSSWWSGVATGKYPKPLKLGQRVTMWRAADIHKLIQDVEAKNV